MKITVASPTYRRAWSLPYMLEGLLSQSRPPDEVIVVLKPSGDGSEDVLKKYEDRLPLRVITQKYGGFVQAVQMAIDAAVGDLLLFIDDDAVPEEKWIEKYEQFFEEVPDAGGASGMGMAARLVNGHPEPLEEAMNTTMVTHSPYRMPWRRPLPELHDYCEYISISGFNAGKACDALGMYYKSTSLWGANMAFRTKAIAGAPIGKLYEGSRKGLYNESLLAYVAVKRGYATYSITDREISPTVLHLETESLTRGYGFFHEFWIHYDRVRMFHRLKRMGAKVSLGAYIAACLITARKHAPPRILATIYAQMR